MIQELFTKSTEIKLIRLGIFSNLSTLEGCFSSSTCSSYSSEFRKYHNYSGMLTEVPEITTLNFNRLGTKDQMWCLAWFVFLEWAQQYLLIIIHHVDLPQVIQELMQVKPLFNHLFDKYLQLAPNWQVPVRW